MTIKQYISEMRMERARELLTQTYDTVDEIAAKCGYSNGNYLLRRSVRISTCHRPIIANRWRSVMKKEPRT